MRNMSVLAGSAMTVIVIVATLSLSGCAIHYHKEMDKDLKALVGKDIGTVVSKLGYPSNKLTIGGETVYVWDENGCTIHIGTDASGRIVRSDYAGGRRDCERYYDALDTDINPPPPAKTAKH